jgi:fatty-acyl-CoA synthase
VALTPLGFLSRAAHVYPKRTAWRHGSRSATYGEFYTRARRLASAVAARGIGPGDTVAIMAPNIPAMLEAHYGVPMTGAVLNALNIRLDAPAIAFILDHGEAKILFTDRAFSAVIGDALKLAKGTPLVIDIDDAPEEGGEFLGGIEYEDFIAHGDAAYAWRWPADEWEAISLCYTSGTTGDPKGVVLHHRGAYLNAIGNALAWGLGDAPVYLWTLPMFHCNGWCFTWTITAQCGTHVCLRKTDAAAVFDAIASQGVDHFCGAPIILNMLVNAPPEMRAQARTAATHQVEVMTAAAPPPAAVIAAMERDGFHVTHVYGLTETYGPVTLCAWHGEWDALDPAEQAALKARQGVAYVTLDGLGVVNRDGGAAVPADGATIGEVVMRGNTVMKGYFKNPAATEDAFAGGWFHTGDLGVMHKDGYIELKDRAKDIIISGGENISTIEIENTLYKHPAVLEAAVIGRPDDTWGETPCAFVTLKDGAQASEADLIAFCRDNMAHFKAPKTIIFGALPKTSTGKVQKFALRERALLL